MSRLIVCRNCTEPDCTYCNMNILAVALERGFFNSLMGEQHTVQIDSELVPVRHGHWNEAKDGTLWCSVCISTGPYDEDSWGYVYNAPHYDYCPNCGAKMDEVTEDG